jgi:hypothetical protein
MCLLPLLRYCRTIDRSQSRLSLPKCISPGVIPGCPHWYSETLHDFTCADPCSDSGLVKGIFPGANVGINLPTDPSSAVVDLGPVSLGDATVVASPEECLSLCVDSLLCESVVYVTGTTTCYLTSALPATRVTVSDNSIVVLGCVEASVTEGTACTLRTRI